MNNNKGEGRGGLINFHDLKRGSLLEREGLKEDLRYLHDHMHTQKRGKKELHILRHLVSKGFLKLSTVKIPDIERRLGRSSVIFK